jgi:putative hydrolase of the HAD superfamily
MVAAVLFDLFETLITESRSRPTRASSLGEALGLEREAFRTEWKVWRPRVVLGQLSFGEALTEISLKLVGDTDEAAVQRLCEQRIREKAGLFTQHEPEVREMISELRRRGVSLAVVSNCFAEDVSGWSTWPLAHEFQCAVFSHAVGLAKPDPQIYLTATGRLGVDPSASVFIGDGGDAELGGAERAGLRAFRAGWFAKRSGRGESSLVASVVLINCEDVLRLVSTG